MAKVPYLIKGYPTEVGEYIEMPDIAELLLMPIFNHASIETVRKHGSEFQNMLIDKAPIKYDKPYVNVNSFVQFLSPRTRPSILKLGVPEYENEWHFDGNWDVWRVTDRHHLIISDCTARTEFNEIEKVIFLDSDIDNPTFRHMANSLDNTLGIRGRKIEPNKFITFENELHRACTPEKHEFRFFFRIAEGNEPNNSPEMAIGDKSLVFGRDGAFIPNIEHRQGGIFINLP